MISASRRGDQGPDSFEEQLPLQPDQQRQQPSNSPCGSLIERAEQRERAAQEAFDAAEPFSDAWQEALRDLHKVQETVRKLRDVQGSAQLSRCAAVDEPNVTRVGPESVGESSVAQPTMASRAEPSPPPDDTVQSVTEPTAMNLDVQDNSNATMIVSVSNPKPNDEPTRYPGFPSWMRGVLQKKSPDARVGIAGGGRGTEVQEEPIVSINLRVRLEDLPDFDLVSEISRWAPDILFGTWGRLMRWINQAGEPDEVKKRIIDQWCKIQTMPWIPIIYQFGLEYTRLNPINLTDDARRSLAPQTCSQMTCYEYAHKHRLGDRTLLHDRVTGWPKARPPTLREQQMRNRDPEHGSAARIESGCRCEICEAYRFSQNVPVAKVPPPVAVKATAPPAAPPAKQKPPPPPLPEHMQKAAVAKKAPPPALPADADNQRPPTKAPPAKGQCAGIAKAGHPELKAPPPHIQQSDRSTAASEAEPTPTPAPAATEEREGPDVYDISTPPTEQHKEPTYSKIRFAADTKFECKPRIRRTKVPGDKRSVRGTVGQLRAYNALNLEPASMTKAYSPHQQCKAVADCPHCPPPSRDAAHAEAPEPLANVEDNQEKEAKYIEVFEGCYVSKTDAVIRQGELFQIQLKLEKELDALMEKDVVAMKAGAIVEHYAEVDELAIRLRKLQRHLEKEKPNAAARAKTYLKHIKDLPFEATPVPADSPALDATGFYASSEDEQEKKVKTDHQPAIESGSWPAVPTPVFPPAMRVPPPPPLPENEPVPPPPLEAPPPGLDIHGYAMDTGSDDSGDALAPPPFTVGKWVEGEDFSKVEKWLRNNYRILRLGEMNDGRAMDPILPTGVRSPYEWGAHTQDPRVTNECLPHMGDGQPGNTLWQSMAREGFNPVTKQYDIQSEQLAKNVFWDPAHKRDRVRQQMDIDFPRELCADDGYDDMDGPGFTSLSNMPAPTVNPVEQSVRMFALPCTMLGHVGIRQRYTRYQLLEMKVASDMNVDQGSDGQYVADEGMTAYCCSACFHRREGVEHGALHKEFTDLVRWQMAKEHFPNGVPDNSVEVCKELAMKAFEKFDDMAKKNPTAYPDWFGPLRRSKRDFIDLCRVMYTEGMNKAPEDWPTASKHLASLIVYEMSTLSKRLSQSRIAMMGIMTDFCRNVFLRPGMNFSQQRFYVCPHCLRIPKKDRVWFVCRYKGSNNRFFCAACGILWTDEIGDVLKPDSGSRFSYLHTIQIDDKVLMIPTGQPPQGSTNVTGPIILANAAYMGLFDMNQFSENQPWEQFVETMVEYISGENVIADQALDMNQVFNEPLPLKRPEKGMIRRGPAVFTMGPDDIGSYEWFYDLNFVKHLLMPPKVSDYWLIVTNFICLFITATMGAAILASSAAQGKSDLAKRLRKIGGNAVVRENGAWPNGQPATEEEKLAARTELLYPEVEEETRLAWDTARQAVHDKKKRGVATALNFLKAAFVFKGVEQAAARAEAAKPVSYDDENPDFLTAMMMAFFFFVLVGACYLSYCVGHSKGEKVISDDVAKTLKESKDEISQLELQLIRQRREFAARLCNERVHTIPEIRCKNQQTDYTHTSVKSQPGEMKKGRFQITELGGCT